MVGPEDVDAAGAVRYVTGLDVTVKEMSRWVIVPDCVEAIGFHLLQDILLSLADHVRYLGGPRPHYIAVRTTH